MIAERKAQFIYWVARNFIERQVRDVHLDVVDGSTLESAEAWNQIRADHLQSAIHYHSVLYRATDPQVRAEAAIGAVQQLINLGAFRQARRILTVEPPQIIEALPEPRKTLFAAQIEEKQGWIADYELGYQKEKEHFTEAGKILNSLPQDEWDDKVRQVFSTTRHFLGRAEYGLARTGIDKKDNLVLAKEHFVAALSFDEIIEDINREGKLGLGHAWLARCYMLEGDMEAARAKINRAGSHLRRQRELSPPSWGSLAHEELLRGEFDLKRGWEELARKSFHEAIKIRLEKEKYPKGLADAYMGVARTYSWRNPVLFTRYTLLAWQAHPYTVLRSTFGG